MTATFRNGDRVRLSWDGAAAVLATRAIRNRGGTITGSGFTGFYIGKVAVLWDGQQSAEIVPLLWLEPLPNTPPAGARGEAC
jgi:hypothetical protein